MSTTDTLSDKMKARASDTITASRTESDGYGESISRLDDDTAHELLSNARRRAVIDVVPSEGTIDKSTLIDAVSAAENGGEPTENQRKAVQVSLHQNHLPTLENCGVIVETKDGYGRGPNADILESYRRPSTLTDAVFHAMRILRE